MTVQVDWDAIGQLFNFIWPMVAIFIGFTLGYSILRMITSVMSGFGPKAERLDNDWEMADRAMVRAHAQTRAALQEVTYQVTLLSQEQRPAPPPETSGKCRYCGQRWRGEDHCSHCGAPLG